MLTVTIINCVLLFGTAIIVFYYTCETQNLRKIAQVQTGYNAVENRVNDLCKFLAKTSSDEKYLRFAGEKLLEHHLDIKQRELEHFVNPQKKVTLKSKSGGFYNPTEDEKRLRILNIEEELEAFRELKKFRKMQDAILEETIRTFETKNAR